MKRIKLTQGKSALVDDADYEYLSNYKWTAASERSGNFYAIRHSPTKNGKRHTIQMSRQILGLEHGDKRDIDHIHHNTLNNQRDNIRICTRRQNQMNQKPQRNKSSIFKGVSWFKANKKWGTYIRIDGKLKHLGLFTDEEAAAKAYDMAAEKYFGEYACLNFSEVCV